MKVRTRATAGTVLVGGLLLALGVAVLMGWDKWLEAAALAVLPDWALGF